MKLRFYGADRCVTGSCHCLEVNGKNILVDCGLQQGRDEVDNTVLPFHPGSIDVVLVTELANEENEDEWVFPLEGDSADLDDIVRTVFVLNLDSKLLCKEDCKGICEKCGKNLNEGECGCPKREIDPRLSALADLLKD